MANTKSAKNMILVAERNRARKRPLRTAARTYIARARRSITSGITEEGQQAIQQAIQALDRAAQRGAIHPNNAARRKARLMKSWNQLVAGQSEATAKPASQPQARPGRRSSPERSS
jgi:small subunit ribosomal protein S20